MNILLHICCAPCSIYPIAELKRQGHRIAGLFYNPNIHPYSEYLKRKSEVEKYSLEAGINVVKGDYDIEKYFQFITHNESIGKRCPACWWIRLEAAAKFAKESAFDAFTTTLLGSPYQDHDTIRAIGEDLAKRDGLKFYYQDFRTGFRDALNTARSKGIYCQNYCGCIFSERERIDSKTCTVKGKGNKR
ncbi:MAG: epoxyqueuosine reductase QueH [Candidatus Omnitrophica bacterium]|nr:epoxyqueuosine reductase QueH [Candidatus Omnitrophota bacterium]